MSASNGVSTTTMAAAPGPGRPPLSQKDQATLVEKLEAGRTIEEVAVLLGIGSGTVYRYARNLGVVIKGRRAKENPPEEEKPVRVSTRRLKKAETPAAPALSGAPVPAALLAFTPSEFMVLGIVFAAAHREGVTAREHLLNLAAKLDDLADEQSQ